MARRLSAMRFAFQMRGLVDPTETARMVSIWEGIRPTHGAPPDQAAPLMPSEVIAHGRVGQKHWEVVISWAWRPSDRSWVAISRSERRAEVLGR
jgi:hypothetical protein